MFMACCSTARPSAPSGGDVLTMPSLGAVWKRPTKGSRSVLEPVAAWRCRADLDHVVGGILQRRSAAGSAARGRRPASASGLTAALSRRAPQDEGVLGEALSIGWLKVTLIGLVGQAIGPSGCTPSTTGLAVWKLMTTSSASRLPSTPVEAGRHGHLVARAAGQRLWLA